MATHRRTDQLLTLAALTTASLLAACSGSGSSADKAARIATANDFLAPAPAAAPGQTEDPKLVDRVQTAKLPRLNPPPSADQVGLEDQRPTSDESVDVTSLIGPAPTGPLLAAPSGPNAPSPAAMGVPTGQVVILESLVGQINGRPVFASEVLEPLDGKLRAIAEKSRSGEAWQVAASEEIYGELKRLIENELILAEARASLTVEQKQGLLEFLSRIQEGVVAQQRGSEVAADEALRSSTGRGLQETSRDKLDQALIGEEIRNRVSNRVIVSWRQVQQEYERNFDKYNPDPTAIFRIISTDAAKADKVEQIRTRLSSGESFGAVADSDLNSFGKGDKNKLDKAYKPPLDQAKLFDVDPLNNAARTLTEGAYTGPVALGGSVYWIQLEKIVQPDIRSLYDAQLEIEAALKERRFMTETNRYFDRLKKRGSVSNIRDMITRLVIIANERYWTSGGRKG